VSTAPDYAEPILGWRAWNVVRAQHAVRLGAEFQLHSPVYPVVWWPCEELVAACLHFHLPRRHNSPAAACSCGIYATAEAARAVKYLGPGLYRNRVDAAHRVFGQVALWGLVVECEYGWRAERAYPAHLYIPTYASSVRPLAGIEQIAAGLITYAVPVDVLDADTHADVIEALTSQPPATLDQRIRNHLARARTRLEHPTRLLHRRPAGRRHRG
jgi:hypothetical protein